VFLLDENIPDRQRLLLVQWRLAVKQVGVDAGLKALKDDQVIVLLHRRRNVTFFTRDVDYDRQTLCHRRYCLVVMRVPEDK
jgi:hypothetical protein